MNRIVSINEPVFTKLSLAVVRDGILYISGQGPIDLATGSYEPGSIEDETRMTLGHIEKILQAAGCTRADVAKCTCYLGNLADFDGYHRVFSEFFGEPTPARTTVGSQLLRNIRIEIDAVAHLPKEI